MANITKVAEKGSKNVKIYQFKISLKYIKPAIWRRIQVKNNINLEELHLFLNEAMGWYNSHLHQFIIDGEYYGIADPEFNFDGRVIDEKKIKLTKIINEKQKFLYEYDFGDSWEHDVVLEKVLDIEEGIEYPRCIAGKRACPPEDCGSHPGYEDLCELMNNPNDSEYEEMIEWLGGEKYDPEEFDLEKTDKRVKDAIEMNKTLFC